MERRREVVQQQAVQESNILSTCNLRYKQYLGLVKKITDNATDLGVINNSLQEVKSRFPELLELSHPLLLNVLLDKAPLAVLAMLADADLRPYYLDYDFMGKPYDKKERPYSHDFAKIFSSLFKKGYIGFADDYGALMRCLSDLGEFQVQVLGQFKVLFLLSLNKVFKGGYNYKDFYVELSEKLGRSVCVVNVNHSDWQTIEAEGTKIICLYYNCSYNSSDGYLCSADADTSTDSISVREDLRYFTILNGLQAKAVDCYLNYDVCYVKLD